MKDKLKLLFFSYILIVVGLFLYSFTQIDLSLTFSRIEFLQNIVRSFQQIGYFHRQGSTYLYVGLLVVLFGFYLYFLHLAHRKKITKKFVWRLLLIVTPILTFSYNAFSYDLFNYIFFAKMYTHYHMNPYLHKALDFPGDPMLSFMRWTHVIYPWGPVWLLLTIPLSFIGMGLFIPTFFLFKILMGASFLGSVYFLGKILQKVAPEKEVLGLVFFGLSPVVLIESLVSAHMDIVMIFFSLWSFYYLIKNIYLISSLLLLISIGIKFATAFLIPVYILLFVLLKQKKAVPWNKVFAGTIVLLMFTTLLASLRTNFQPWYVLVPLSFAGFLAGSYVVLIPSVVISFAALLNYVPYLYSGNWDPPIPQILDTLNYTSYAASIVLIIFYRFIRYNKKSKSDE